MHTTIVTLRDGTIIRGSINYFRPCFNWFTLFGNDRKFYFDECESVITPDERISINSPVEGEVCDEIKRAKGILDDGREHKWTEDGKLYPEKKWEWEKRYEV